jgi:hypothetical protein
MRGLSVTALKVRRHRHEFAVESMRIMLEDPSTDGMYGKDWRSRSQAACIANRGLALICRY